MNLESTKQLDDPKSTNASTSTRNREEQTRKLREQGLVDTATSNIGSESWVVIKQLAPWKVSRL